MTKNKYGNIKVSNQWGTFDSQHEYHIFLYLLSRQQKNEISDLQRQVKFELIPKTFEEVETITKTGKFKKKQVMVYSAVHYIADFVYVDNATGETVVVDAKSEATAKDKVFILKSKLFYYIYGKKIEIM